MKIQPVSGIKTQRPSFQKNINIAPINRNSTLMRYKKASRNIFLASLLILAGGIGKRFYTNSYSYQTSEGAINYVEPLKNDFDTRGEALNYAKERVVEALNSDTPYEHAITINNATNEIMGEFKGNKETVATYVSLLDEMKLAWHQKGYTLVHGHPAYKNGNTSPLSFTDFQTLISNDNITEIIALNKKGEISRLRKKITYQPLDTPTISNVQIELGKAQIKAFEAKQPARYQQFIKDYLAATNDAKRDSIDKEFTDITNKQDSTNECIRLVQKFWRKTASSLGLEYFTNYSDSKR